MGCKTLTALAVLSAAALAFAAPTKYEMQTTVIASAKKAASTIQLVGRDLQVNLNVSMAQVSIYDLQGNRVLAKKMSQNGTIALSRLARGPYLVKIQANGLTQSLKITLK